MPLLFNVIQHNQHRQFRDAALCTRTLWLYLHRRAQGGTPTRPIPLRVALTVCCRLCSLPCDCCHCTSHVLVRSSHVIMCSHVHSSSIVCGAFRVPFAVFDLLSAAVRSPSLRQRRVLVIRPPENLMRQRSSLCQVLSRQVRARLQFCHGVICALSVDVCTYYRLRNPQIPVP